MVWRNLSEPQTTSRGVCSCTAAGVIAAPDPRCRRRLTAKALLRDPKSAVVSPTCASTSLLMAMGTLNWGEAPPGGTPRVPTQRGADMSLSIPSTGLGSTISCSAVWGRSGIQRYTYARGQGRASNPFERERERGRRMTIV